MLVQLVCLDRRYQRMNCYNIREIQTILKSKYSPNVELDSDIRLFINTTALGLRYQMSDLTFIDSSLLNFYKNSLRADSQSNEIHMFLNKPVINFRLEEQQQKIFLSKFSIFFKTLYSYYLEGRGNDALKITSPATILLYPFIIINKILNSYTLNTEVVNLVYCKEVSIGFLTCLKCFFTNTKLNLASIFSRNISFS